MRIGYTGWTWISNERDNWNPINERHKENFEQFLKEVSDLGYETVENFNWIADYYSDDIEGFKNVVQKYNLKFEICIFILVIIRIKIMKKPKISGIYEGRRCSLYEYARGNVDRYTVSASHK